MPESRPRLGQNVRAAAPADEAPPASTALDVAAAQAPAVASDKPVTMAEQIKHAIDQQSEAFHAILPATVDPDRFARLVLVACRSTPKLTACFQTSQGRASVLVSALQAAAVGLEPNTMLEECWLTPRARKVDGVWVDECQLSIGYKGYLKLARRSGEIADIYAEVVREGDEFSYSLGLERTLHHVPGTPIVDEGTLEDTRRRTHAYAVARYKDGGVNFVVLNEVDVHARRAKSDGYRNERSRPYNPWTTATDSMWRKSAIRELAKFLPLTAQAASMTAMDDRDLRLDDEAGIIPAHASEWEAAAELEEGGPDEG